MSSVMVYTLVQLRRLTMAFCLGTDTSPRQLGLSVTGNPNLVNRLQDQKGIQASSAETLSNWLRTNWPPDLAWPEGIKRAK